MSKRRKTVRDVVVVVVVVVDVVDVVVRKGVTACTLASALARVAHARTRRYVILSFILQPLNSKRRSHQTCIVHRATCRSHHTNSVFAMPRSTVVPVTITTNGLGAPPA